MYAYVTVKNTHTTGNKHLITHTNTCTYTYYLRSLKFTLKHLKCSHMFRSYDHPQVANIALFLAEVII